MKTTAVLSAALLLVSCSSTPDIAEYPALEVPRTYPNFTSIVQIGSVRAKAVFFSNHSEFFARDLPAKEGLLPIGLKIYVDGKDDGVSRSLEWEDLDARLYLQDGTALTAVQPHHIEIGDPRSKNQVTNFALRPRFIDREERQLEFLYFAFDPDVVEIRGDQEVVHWSRLPKKLSLTGSLLSLNLTRADGQSERINLGLQLDGRGANTLQLQ